MTKQHAKTVKKNAKMIVGLCAMDIGGDVILLNHRRRGELAAELRRSQTAARARTPFERWLIRTGTSYGEFAQQSGISSRGLLHRYATGDVLPSAERRGEISAATSGDVAITDWPQLHGA